MSERGREGAWLLRLPSRSRRIRHLCGTRRHRRGLTLGALLAQRPQTAAEGGVLWALGAVVGVDALLLQALPRLALQPAPGGVVPPGPLARPLLAGPQHPRPVRPLLA